MCQSISAVIVSLGSVSVILGSVSVILGSVSLMCQSISAGTVSLGSVSVILGSVLVSLVLPEFLMLVEKQVRPTRAKQNKTTTTTNGRYKWAGYKDKQSRFRSHLSENLIMPSYCYVK